MYKDPYLQGIERNEIEAKTSEEERLLTLFITWLNVRKLVELGPPPKEFVKEFLSLEKI